MYEINYEIWKEMVEDIAFEYVPLFSIMHEVAKEMPLSRALVDDLKNTKELTISNDPWRMWLQIDLIADNINGFIVYLMASEELNAFENLLSETAEDYGISLEDIDAFEIDHGLDMLGDVFEEIRDKYEIQPETKGSDIIFSLVVFDSQDIDDCKGNDIFWSEDFYTN